MLTQFIGFFVAGLAVNLTPCVYPMLVVTTALFQPKENMGETLRHSFAKALMYFLGIAVMYSSLGYLAASTGKLFGSVLQNEWVLGAVALMMFALGFSMLGGCKITVPGEILNRLSGLRKANYLGLFISGMLVGVFAAPCMGPPILALLAAVANNGDPRFGLLAFFVFSLGLGLPYLILGTFSKLATRLPKAGGWLIWVEKLFGVILLGFAVFYLSMALNWHWPASQEKSVWAPYSEQAVSAAIDNGEPVIIDFFAEWCIGCHELERDVFSKLKIRSQLEQVTALRVDATNVDTPQVEAVIDRYGIIGLPTVLFLDANGDELKQFRVEGTSSIADFSQSLNDWGGMIGLDTKQKGVDMKNEQAGQVRIYDVRTQTYQDVDRVVKSDEEWKAILTPEQYRVTRDHGTERAFCGLPMGDHQNGIYQCSNCRTDLFLVDKKFESGTGWPSFWQPVDEANVGYTEDTSFGMRRVEVHCARCGVHLGHVFDDGPPPTHKRYCINSVSLVFEPSSL